MSFSNATATASKAADFSASALPLGGARAFGIAQRQGVVAEHRDRARHGADLVGAPTAADGNAEIAIGHLCHRPGNAP